MNREELFEQIIAKKSFLCVGLDSDIKKLPKHLLSCEDPIFEFNKQIIDATAPYTVCYKPNLAFYETEGGSGFETYFKTVDYIKSNYPNIFVIADAKRGDIGNTSEMYARAFFATSQTDAVTLSPYMGSDTVVPFYKYENRWAVILALTSNPSAADFEMLPLSTGEKVYERVLKNSKEWGNVDNTMYVVGATKASMLESIRAIVPDHFLLVPGVGAQGGSLQDVATYGMNSKCGLLVNSSRGVIFADSTENFALRAGEEAKKLQEEMALYLEPLCK